MNIRDAAQLRVTTCRPIQFTYFSNKRLGRINAYESRQDPSRCTVEDAKQTYLHPSRADMDISHVVHRSTGVLNAPSCPALECDTNYFPTVTLFADDAGSDSRGLLPTMRVTRVVQNIEFV